MITESPQSKRSRITKFENGKGLASDWYRSLGGYAMLLI